MNKTYDYIIAGMGCAGLSLAVQLKKSGLAFKKVLLVDRVEKNKNDRTWCFWTKAGEAWYSPMIKKSWTQLAFVSEAKQKFDLGPYQYHLITGEDFYRYCLAEIKADERFALVYEDIVKMDGTGERAFLETTREKYEATYIFNSALRHVALGKGHNNLVQHFKGWLVKFEAAVVDEDCPVFMDFSVPQQDDCRFVYTVPYAKDTALIEYTGFSKEALPGDEYDVALRAYIDKNYENAAYQIIGEEAGQIPMYESKFMNPYGGRVVNIGTAGNASKASSGYTFYFIQKSTAAIVRQLMAGEKKLQVPAGENRFKYYDKVLLDVIGYQRVQPARVFGRLFGRNKIVDLLDFLNEESDLFQELRIINQLPKRQFLFAGIKKLLV